MYRRVPDSGCSAVSTVAGRSSGAPVCAGERVATFFEQRSAGLRFMGLSAVPANASLGEGSGGADRRLLRLTRGPHLFLHGSDGESQSAICFRLDVFLL